jgi:hypothetical protein
MTFDEHVAGTARVAIHEAEETLRRTRIACERVAMEKRRLTHGDYMRLNAAIKAAQECLGFLHRLQHAIAVKDHAR